MVFPVEADQAHYLTIMTNRCRWRTPSPAHDGPQAAHREAEPEGAALTRCGLVVGEGDGVPLGEGLVPRPQLGVDKDVGVVEEDSCTPLGEEGASSLPYHPQTHTHPGEDPWAGVDVQEVVGDEEADVECLVVSLDSSRAASLTRTCKWAGYKKVNTTPTISLGVDVYGLIV